MKTATFYQELLQGIVTQPMTEAEATAWFLFLHTHFIGFPEGTIEDCPEAGGIPSAHEERAAQIISAFWQDRGDERANESYWMRKYEQEVPFSYLVDMPPTLRTQVQNLRQRVERDPRITEVEAVDERFMSACVPAEIEVYDGPPVELTFVKDGPDLWRKSVPTRFRIGSVDLLGFGDDPYLPLSLVDVAPRGMGCLRIAYRYGRAALDFTEDEHGHHLIFKRDDEQMIVYNTGNQVGARIQYDILFAEWMRFALEVRDIVLSLHPEERNLDWWKLITDQPENREHFIESVTYDSFFNRYDR